MVKSIIGSLRIAIALPILCGWWSGRFLRLDKIEWRGVARMSTSGRGKSETVIHGLPGL